MTKSPNSYHLEFPKDELVYLTADSPNTIETLDPSKIYIIGGIVDRNRYKNLTLNRATEHGVATAKLPIGNIIQLYSSPVLTVNHVMGMLIKYGETRDWRVAVESVVPQRKRKREEGDEDDDECAES